MPELIVKCKTCGKWFGTGIKVANSEELRTLKPEINYHTCPRGHRHRYHRTDYRY